jgi:hypothetical protein
MRIFTASLSPNRSTRRDFLVRASGWTVGFGWCAAAASGASAAATVTNENTRVASDRDRSVLAFRTVVEPHGSYLTVQIQIQPRLQNATLVAPDGRRIALMPLLRRLPAEQTQKPAQGDIHFMTEVVRDPAPGAWQLVLDHDRHATAHSILWQVVQQPRFAAALSLIGGDALKVGVEADVVLALTAFGMPSGDGRPGPLVVTRANGTRSSHPLILSGTTGRFIARIPVDMPGPLHLAVESHWPPMAGVGSATVVAQRRLSVVQGAAASLSVSPLSTAIERDAKGCIRSVTFSLPWQATVEGMHVLAISLGAGRRITGSVEVSAPGPATLTAVLRGQHLAKIAPGPILQAEAVEVVLAAGEGPLLMRRSTVPLTEPFDPSNACR